MDHLTACDTFSLRRVRFLVLDEADRLIAGRFDSDLATIMAALPQHRQTLLFSATCNDTLRQLESIANNEVGSDGAHGSVLQCTGRQSYSRNRW